MNLLTLIVGMPSTGKTTSFRNLGPETVMYVTEKKMLPFKNNGIKVVVTATVNDLLNKLNRLKGNNYPQITNVVLDCFSDYSDMVMSECKSKYKGFAVYNAYNTKMYELFQALKAIDNKFIFLICHPEVRQFSDGNIIYRIPVYGKYHDGKIEKLATCVFYADPKRRQNGKGVEYLFLTNTDGRYAKTPIGMYEQMHIENDIQKVIEVYRAFYTNEIPVMKADVAA